MHAGSYIYREGAGRNLKGAAGSMLILESFQFVHKLSSCQQCQVHFHPRGRSTILVFSSYGGQLPSANLSFVGGRWVAVFSFIVW